MVKSLILIIALLVCATGVFAQTRTRHDAKKNAAKTDSEPAASSEENHGEVVGKLITFADGRTMVVNEAWRQGAEVWYTLGGVTQSLTSEVTKIDPVYAARKKPETTAVNQPTPAKPALEKSLWIYLVGGARFKVDDVNETPAGAWYHRGTVSVFVDKERID